MKIVKGDFVRYTGTEEQLIRSHIPDHEARKIMENPVGIARRLSANLRFIEVSFYHTDDEWMVKLDSLTLLNKKQLKLIV